MAKVVSGDNPLQAIVDLVGAYWARIEGPLPGSALMWESAFRTNLHEPFGFAASATKE
jgi:hypothetical protein